MLDVAIAYAAEKHKGQFDKGGQPYILHPLAVMHMVSKYTSNEAVRAIAVLHDVVEDTDATINDIKGRFGNHVAEMVDLLSKRKGQSYDDYLERVMDNPKTMIVKAMDLRHNSDLTRLKDKGVSQKDIDRHKKYMVAYGKIALALQDFGIYI